MQNGTRALRGALLSAAAVVLLLPFSTPAQTNPERITAAIDETRLSTLHGNTHPLARPEFDRGPAPASLPMQRMLLVLTRSPQQESSLETLLEQQQDASSFNFHNWLTPQQFGQQFGPSDQDIQTIRSWLESHGFQVAGVSSGRTVIEFSGTAGQVQQAFHTTIHQYAVNGETHWANSSDPQIPAALLPLVAGINTLYNFPRRQMHEVVGVFSRIRATGEVKPVTPLFTFPNPCFANTQPFCNFAVAPADFAKIYNVPNLLLSPAPLTQFNGDGVTIAIVGDSEINTADLTQFRALFGLPAPKLNVVVNGPDPGIVSGSETEADLDTQWAGAVAPNATIDFVVAQDTEVSLGVDLAAQYAVDNNLAPVLSESFGVCEFFMGTADNTFYNQLWQQASAEGISVTVSAGDGGSTACDQNAGTQGPAEFGLSVSGFASTPYNIAVGGTDFNDVTNFATFWNLTSGDTPTTASAKGYIPEMSWNDTCTNQEIFTFFGTSTAEQTCNNATASADGLVNVAGGSGGKSGCTVSDFAPSLFGSGSLSSCSGGYAKPAWQTALTPADAKRDVPDVSLFASNGFNSSFYLICESDLVLGATSCDPYAAISDAVGVGGTSASTPAFAGIMALVNQATGSRQGNANYILYKLAGQSGSTCLSAANPASTCLFYDVPSGSTIAMPCAKGSPNCTVSIPADSVGVLSGYATASGYDLATGLGSVNANNLITGWKNFALTVSSTSLTLNSGNPVSITHGQSVSVSIGVTGSGGTPTGNVSLIANTGPGGTEGVQGFTLNSGSASGSTNALPGGTNYTVVAQYSGDGTFGSSTSTPPITVNVAPEASKISLAYELQSPTTGAVTNSNATTAVFGTPSFLRVNVTSQAGDACPNNAPGNTGCPTGTIALTDNYNGGGAAPLDGGTFALNAQGYTEDFLIDLAGGTHQLSATFAGDSGYSAPASPGAETLTITPAPTSTTANAFPNNATVGSSVNLSASISAQNIYSNHAPTGTVTFFAGATEVGSATVSGNASVSSHQGNGVASTSTTSLPHGQSSITAQYGGDASYLASTSAPTSITLLYQTTMAVTLSPSSVIYGQNTSVTVTATVSTGQPGSNAALKPTGSISFSGCASINGAVTTTTGQDASGNWILQVTVTTVPQQSETVCVNYSGDSNYAGTAQSANINVTIPDFTVSSNISSLTIMAGQTGTATLTITPKTNYTSTVTLSCGNLYVAGSTCSFSPSSVNLNNGASATATLSLTVPAPSSNLTAMLSPHNRRIVPLFVSNPDLWWAMGIGSMFISVLALVAPPKWRCPRRIRALIFVGGVAFALGCGGGGGSTSGGGGGSGGPGGGGALGPSATTTTLTSSTAKIAPGASAMLSATVKASSSSSVPTGSVNFNDASFPGVIASSVNLVGGTAQAQMSNTGSLSSAPGAHAITAQYSGDSNDLASQSGSLNIVVQGTVTQNVFGQTGSDSHYVPINVTIQ